jgi:hypothetical protein
LCREMRDLQPLNPVVIRTLGFPTSYERLMVWLRAKGQRYTQLEMRNLEQMKLLYLDNNKLTSVPKEIKNMEHKGQQPR